jgi:hypothetical protein
MDYADAKKIRGQSFGSRMADKLTEGQGFGSSIKATLSEGSKARMAGIKEKFDPINIGKFFGGKLGAAVVGKLTGRSQKDMEYFTGKKSSTKIGKLESGNEMVDMLMKIYSLMQKTNEDNKKMRDDENKFKEEKEMERLRRHKELIEAITGKPYTGKASVVKKEEDSGGGGLGGIISDILDAFGGARTAMSLLSMLGGFVASPLGVALIGAVVAGTIGAWMVKQIAADPQAALEGKGGIGMAVAGLGSEGQLPSYDEEKAQAILEAKAKAVDVKGMSKASVDELEAKRDLLVSYGKAKSPEVIELVKEIQSRKSSESAGATATPLPSASTGSQSSPAPTASPTGSESSPAPTASPTGSESSPAPTAMAQSVPSPNSGQQLNQVQGENLTAKVQETLSEGESVVNNNAISKSLSSNDTRGPLPPVRNHEETFAKMIYESTRVV